MRNNEHCSIVSMAQTKSDVRGREISPTPPRLEVVSGVARIRWRKIKRQCAKSGEIRHSLSLPSLLPLQFYNRASIHQPTRKLSSTLSSPLSSINVPFFSSSRRIRNCGEKRLTNKSFRTRCIRQSPGENWTSVTWIKKKNIWRVWGRE